MRSRPGWRVLAGLMVTPVALMPAAFAQTMPYGAGPGALLPPPPPLVRPPKPTPPKLEHMRKIHAEGVLGQPVLSDDGKVIGHVVDVLIDQTGVPKAAVIEFAGFLGLGDRKIAVAWDALHFAVVKGEIVITLGLDADKLKALPEYQPEAKSVPVAVAKPKGFGGEPTAKAAP